MATKQQVIDAYVEGWRCGCLHGAASLLVQQLGCGEDEMREYLELVANQEGISQGDDDAVVKKMIDRVVADWHGLHIPTLLSEDEASRSS